MTRSRHPRILLVTRNLPPLVGGMERLNWHMAEELAKVAEVRIVGPQGSAAVAPAGIDVHEAPLKPLWKFLLIAARLARREARRWRPDTVLAGSGLTAPLVWFAARACGARTAAYVHGLDIAVKHPAYRALWLPAIRRMDRVIANSRATADLCRDIGTDPARIAIVHPGVDLPDAPSLRTPPGGDSESTVGDPGAQDRVVSRSVDSGFQLRWSRNDGVHGSSFRTSQRGDPESTTSPQPTATLTAHITPDANTFRQRHHPGNHPVLLSVGRLSTRKGLREFVTLALPRIVAAQPETLLVIIGDAPSQALHAEAQTPASIQAAADVAGVGKHLLFLGKVSDDELAQAYRAADVHVFPIRDIPGDPEGFGMVAIEAAAHGLPTVAFATGGIVDAVAEGRSGKLVESGDYSVFAAAVIQTLDQREALRGSCRDFAQGFAWSSFGGKLWSALRANEEV